MAGQKPGHSFEKMAQATSVAGSRIAGSAFVFVFVPGSGAT